MENLKHPPFVGTWFIVRQECRVAGKWQHEYDFAPDEWPITFHKNHFFGEILRSDSEIPKVLTGRWDFDPAAGVISIRKDESPMFVDTCVFEVDEGGAAYLYFFDDEQHIPPDGRAIIDHHAAERRLLAKV